MLKKTSMFFLICVAVMSGCNQNTTPETSDYENKTQTDESESPEEKSHMEGVVTFDTAITKYIAAPSGLSVRQKPDASAEKITVLPFGTKIRVYRQTEETESVSDAELGLKVTGHWLYIKDGKTEGWLFGGYTSMMKMTQADHALILLAERPIQNKPNFNEFAENDIIRDENRFLQLRKNTVRSWMCTLKKCRTHTTMNSMMML